MFLLLNPALRYHDALEQETPIHTHSFNTSSFIQMGPPFDLCLWPMDPWGCPIWLCRRFFSSLNSPGFPSKLRGFQGEEDLELIKDEWSRDRTLLLGPLPPSLVSCLLVPSIPLPSLPPLSPRLPCGFIPKTSLTDTCCLPGCSRPWEFRSEGAMAMALLLEGHTDLGELRRGRGWLCWQIQGAWPAKGPEDWHWLQLVNSDRLVYLVGDLLKSH